MLRRLMKFLGMVDVVREYVSRRIGVRTLQKRKRNLGQAYVNKVGRLVPAKKIGPVCTDGWLIDVGSVESNS